MSAIRDPYQSYRQTQVETADQATLLLMLYSGALKFLGLARKAMAEDDVEETNRLLGKVQDILCELMSSLNPDLPDISGGLFQLYEYMHHQLVQANVKKEGAPIEEVEKMLNILLEAWQEAIRQEKPAAPASALREG
jgi:flagellar secretion chaperone FliS